MNGAAGGCGAASGGISLCTGATGASVAGAATTAAGLVSTNGGTGAGMGAGATGADGGVVVEGEATTRPFVSLTDGGISMPCRLMRAGMTAGLSPAPTRARTVGPVPNCQRLAAGWRADWPLALMRNTRFTTSVSAQSYPLMSDSQRLYCGGLSIRSRLPGMRRSRVRAICEPKPAAR